MEVEAEAGVEEMMSLIDDYQDGDLKKGEFYRTLKDMNQGTLAKGILILCDRLYDCEKDCGDLHRRNMSLCDTLHRKNEKMKCSLARLKNGMAFWKSCAHGEFNPKIDLPLPCKSCDLYHSENMNLSREISVCDDLLKNLSLACDDLAFENNMLKSNASMPCNSCVALNNDLDEARSKIALLESSASLPCVSCESLLAEIKELKLTHTTCVDELEHARAEICDMKSMPCSKCSLFLEVDACHTSCDNHDALLDVNDDSCSCGLICTSCIDLENEVLALRKMRDDMSAKLVEHDEMSANLEKENELLRTTYAKCIEKEIENLRNIPCGTCERFKYENGVLLTRCKSLCAKTLDFLASCHSNVDAPKIASSQLELTSSLERESLDGGTCASALDSSSIATPKLVASSGVAQDDSNGKGASHFFGTHNPKPKFHCTFCKKDGHTVEFCFRRVKHERRVRAKAFRKPRSPSHGTCGPSMSSKLSDVVGASCSKSQGTSHLQENGDSSTRTVPTDRPLYHCSHCGKDGHQESFCYRRARKMRRAGASRPLVVHSLSRGMNTCEPKKARFVDGFYDAFSSELGHDRGHASSASCVGSRHASHGARVGSSPKTSRDHCLFARGSTRSSSRVAPLRHGSKGVFKSSHLNRHLHHANPHDKLSASFARVTKCWIPKYMLANPLGSKTRSSLSSHV